MQKNDWLMEKLKSYYSKYEIEKILNGWSVNRFTTFRINTLKVNKKDVYDKLISLNYELEEIPWYSNAFLVKNKNEQDLMQLEYFQNGSIYLQSLSSLLPVYFLEPKEKETILDMAAAPGSKTTQMGMETFNTCSITACEKNKIRFERLKFNLQKQGITSCTVLNMDARDLDDEFVFDKVLLDAPCTGTGTLNIKNIMNNKMLEEDSLKKIQKTQIELLRKGLKILKPNHFLIYSTCSILKDENEQVIQEIQKEFDVSIVPIFIEGLPMLKSDINGVITVAPNEYYEGFFIAKIKKNK